MKEQLVILAKTKGYNSFHTVNREVGNGWYIELCLLQKWLREVHKINVESNYLPNIQKYRCLFVPMTKKIPNKIKYSLRSKYYGNIDYNTYEEALEAGLLEGLKLIKL